MSDKDCFINIRISVDNLCGSVGYTVGGIGGGVGIR